MAWTRIYLFNFVQINDPLVEEWPGYLVKVFQRMSFVIGWIIFGNLGDNAFDPKVYIVFCSFAIGLYFLSLGCYLEVSSSSIKNTDKVIVQTKQVCMVMYAGVYAISMIQLFNWFPRRFRGTIIAMFLTAELIGFFSPFFSKKWWSYFPIVPIDNREYLNGFAK